MEDTDLYQTISRLRRDMPRNAGVMAVCDALEGLLVKQRRSNDMEVNRSNTVNKSNKFDRTAYMREYMRRRRAKR